MSASSHGTSLPPILHVFWHPFCDRKITKLVAFTLFLRRAQSDRSGPPPPLDTRQSPVPRGAALRRCPGGQAAICSAPPPAPLKTPRRGGAVALGPRGHDVRLPENRHGPDPVPDGTNSTTRAVDRSDTAPRRDATDAQHQLPGGGGPCRGRNGPTTARLAPWGPLANGWAGV